MAGEPAGPVTGEHVRALTEAARAEALALDQDATERKEAGERAEARAGRRFRAALYALGSAVVVLLLGLVGVAFLAVDAGERAAQAETARQQADIRAVAAELAQPVAEKVLTDGRAQSALTYREGLDRANRRLLRAGLPIVAQPPPEAPAAEVQRQSIRATVLADLGSARPIAEALRRQFEGLNSFPALASLDDPSVPAEPGAAGDITVTILPDEPTPGGFGVDSPQPRPGDRRGRPGATPDRGADGGGGGRTERPAPPRAPAPAPTRSPGGLLPDLPLVPRLPLLGG